MVDKGGLDDFVLCTVHPPEDTKVDDFALKARDYIHSHYSTRYSFILPEPERVLENRVFSAGEYDPRFIGDITDKDIYIFGFANFMDYGSGPVMPGELMNRLGIAAEAALANGAHSVKAVLPDLPFSRADKSPRNYDKSNPKYANVKGRGSSAMAQVNMLAAAGISGIMTFDVHSDEVRGYIRSAMGDAGLLEIDPLAMYAHYLAKHSLVKNQRLVLIAPDVGSKQRVDYVAEVLRVSYSVDTISALYLDKMRSEPNNPDAIHIDVLGVSDNFTTLQGAYGVFIDDIVDTAGTLTKGSKKVIHDGVGIDGDMQKPSGLVTLVTHPTLAGRSYISAMQKLMTGHFDEIVMSNTHPHMEDLIKNQLKGKLSFIRMAHPVGQAIMNVQRGRSLDRIFTGGGDVVRPDIVERYFNLKRHTDWGKGT